MIFFLHFHFVSAFFGPKRGRTRQAAIGWDQARRKQAPTGSPSVSRVYGTKGSGHLIPGCLPCAARLQELGWHGRYADEGSRTDATTYTTTLRNNDRGLLLKGILGDEMSNRAGLYDRGLLNPGELATR